MTETVTALQSTAMEEIFMRISSDLAMVTDVQVSVDGLEHEHVIERPCGEGSVHIAFRLGFSGAGADVYHGCLLMPLPDAQVLAASLLMLPAADVQSARESSALDRTAKDAVLEVGSFVTGAAEAALRALGQDSAHLTFEGCQGVRADVRPMLQYEDGDVLVVARAQAYIGTEGPSTWLLMVPPGAFPRED